MFFVPCESEKLSCDGRPMATLRLLETVEMTGLLPFSRALMRTGVGSVPSSRAQRPVQRVAGQGEGVGRWRVDRLDAAPFHRHTAGAGLQSQLDEAAGQRIARGVAHLEGHHRRLDEARAAQENGLGAACTKATLDSAGASILSASERLTPVAVTTASNWSLVWTAPQPLSRYCMVTVRWSL